MKIFLLSKKAISKKYYVNKFDFFLKKKFVFCFEILKKRLQIFCQDWVDLVNFNLYDWNWSNMWWSKT